jgi:hypothetical protein
MLKHKKFIIDYYNVKIMSIKYNQRSSVVVNFTMTSYLINIYIFNVDILAYRSPKA